MRFLLLCALISTVHSFINGDFGDDVFNDTKPLEQWTVHLKEGVDPIAYARSLDMEIVQHLSSMGNVYLLRPTQSTKREDMIRSINANLAKTDLHFWAEQDVLRTYHKYQRDPNFGQQWHLQNDEKPGNDANVKRAWKLGVDGSGVQIAIVDDSFQTTHPDLSPGYVPADSFNFNDNNNNPNPVAVDDNHGTSCAGVAGARDDGATCGVGAAFRASLAGVRTIGGPISDAGIGQALTYKNQNNDIYSCSWGIPDCVQDPNTGAAACRLVPISNVKVRALETGTREGRGGKGNIYVFAAGNYRTLRSNTNYQDFCTQKQVIAVAASTDNGYFSYYSTAGSGLLIAAPSSGIGNRDRGITTSDRIGTGLGYSATDCTSTFGGTSSATPLVAGIIALMLQKNPALTWRDVQDILVHTATKIDKDSNGWQTNGAGLHVSHDYGFGNVDAEAAVKLADDRTIHLVCDEQDATPVTTVNQAIPDASDTGVTSKISVASIGKIVQIESMRVTVNIQHAARGNLEIALISPSGTKSVLAEQRNDAAPNYVNWNFKTNLNWDEKPTGDWTLQVKDRVGGSTGTLNDWSMTFYGKCAGEEQPKKGLSAGSIAGIVIGVIVGVAVAGVVVGFVVVRKRQGKSVLPFKG